MKEPKEDIFNLERESKSELYKQIRKRMRQDMIDALTTGNDFDFDPVIWIQDAIQSEPYIQAQENQAEKYIALVIQQVWEEVEATEAGYRAEKINSKN